MVALEFGTAKNIAVAIVIGLAVLCLIVAAVIRTVTTKVVVIVALVGIGALVWTEREDLQDCGGRARGRAEAGDRREVTCSFLGQDIDVDLPG